MPDLDRDDIADALHSAAIWGGKRAPGYSSNVPMVASDRSVRRLRQRVEAFLAQLPGDMTIEELRELLGSAPTTNTEDDGDDE